MVWHSYSVKYRSADDRIAMVILLVSRDCPHYFALVKRAPKLYVETVL
jgi:hypothetical protein